MKIAFGYLLFALVVMISLLIYIYTEEGKISMKDLTIAFMNSVVPGINIIAFLAAIMTLAGKLSDSIFRDK